MTAYEQWIREHLPDLTGRRVIVTGANSGLGFEASKLLAARGAEVTLAVRNLAKGVIAAQSVRAAVPAARLEVRLLDLADLASVRQFASAFCATYDRLDILLNNAGLMAIPRRETRDGFEMQFGVNHLGHFALTGWLLPMLLANPAARIVTVSSGIHVAGSINFADLHSKRGYSNWRAYAQSKLANLLFAYELQRRLEQAGSTALSVAAHPGYAATNLQAVGPAMTGSRSGQALMQAANRVMAQSAAMGALPPVYAAAAVNVRGGDYYGPGSLMGLRGLPVKSRSSRRSHDHALAARLWAVSEGLTRVVYGLT